MQQKYSEDDLLKEFDRQLENLISKNYPNLTGSSTKEFTEKVNIFRSALRKLSKIEFKGNIPFVITIKNSLINSEQMMELVDVKGTKGHVQMTPKNPSDFNPIKGLEIPENDIYLMIDIDTGQESLNITPDDALVLIKKQNRSPITINEGIAILTHYPEALKDKKNYNCFSMLGSRAGDKRVPAMWISYGKPRLGWCWAGNPHTWLGSASCGLRI